MDLEEALKEVELHQKGKLNLGTWEDFKKELNLDEDIKIIEKFIKEVQEEYSETLVDGKVYRIENFPIEFKPTKELAKSIENVLSELEENRKTLKCTQDSWYKDTQELEKYKKIAEKLAEELDKLTVESKEWYLGWARKEVEK